MFWQDEIITKWMSKNPLRAYKGKKAPEAPQAVNSEVWSDGNLTGRTTLNGNTQKQESFLTPFQKQQQAFNQSQMPTVQQRLFNPTQDMKDSWQSIANANKDTQMRAFNQDFNKSQNQLIQNLSNRGLANTSTAAYLGNELGKTASDQLANINNQYIADQQNARNQDYNYNLGLYNLLNGGLADQLQTNNNNIANAMTGFNSGNQFNQNNYQMQMYKYLQEQQLKAQQQQSMMNNAMKIGGVIAAPFTGGASLALTAAAMAKGN